MPLLGAMFLWHPNPMLLLIGLLAAPQLVKAWKYDPERPRTRATTRSRRGAGSNTSALYFGLAVYLAFMAYRTHELISAGAPR